MSDAPFSLTDAQLEHVARLARLQLDPAQIPQLQRDLTAIVTYFQELQAIDTEGVLPMQHPLDGQWTLRADQASIGLPNATVMALAPVHDQGLFIVPRVVAHGG